MRAIKGKQERQYAICLVNSGKHLPGYQQWLRQHLNDNLKLEKIRITKVSNQNFMKQQIKRGVT